MNPITVIRIARPGNVAIHGALRRKLRPSLKISPHSGDGGCAPKPRKLIALAVRRAEGNVKVARTKFGEKILGKIYRNMILESLSPIAFPAST